MSSSLPPRLLRCGRHTLSIDAPRVVGIVNLTPDSFSDGGRFLEAAAAIAHAEKLISEGAAIIDLGAESSRPGAIALPLDEELRRLMPVLRVLRDIDVPLSVDTYKPEVMRAALDAGASMINDIFALRHAGALEVIAASDCAVCVMHMQGEPQTMHLAPSYGDVIAEVRRFLAERVAALVAAGVAKERIVVDPGFGFGKSLQHNYRLLGEFAAFTHFGVAALAGISRKGMLGKVVGREPEQRVSASVAAALAAVARGARLLRVHDVAATVDALKVWEMVENCARSETAQAVLNNQN